MRHRWLLLPAVSALLPLACAGDDDQPSTGTPRLDVAASFYPVEFVAARVGGDRVAVVNLTPAGTEPHDLELTGHDTATLQDADLVVYLAELSPAVDEAVDSVAADHALDVAPAAGLAGEDLHFWLDPTRLAAVADAVAERLATLDPDGAATYRANAAALSADLDQLDTEFRDGLRSCASTLLVTSHSAFGYLAERYGLTQVGISGLTPEDEPSPADLAAITDLVRSDGVRTIYSETLVDPAIAATVAAETGAASAVLDPLEGLAESAAAVADYLSVMRVNLATLREGQGCT